MQKRRTKTAETDARPSGGLVGYLIVVEGDKDELTDLAPGLVVDNQTDAPPWIVVGHDLSTSLIPNWPFSIWKVQVLKAMNPQGHMGDYTRCSAIKVVECVPSYTAFGESDTGLCDILQFASQLTLEQAHELSRLRSEDARAIYNLAWHRWLHATPTQPVQIKDYEHVVNVGGAKGGSPIGCFLKLNSRVVFDQAGRADPDSAYGYEDDGTPFLKAPWSTACAALNDAAMTFGARQLFNSSGIVEMREPLRQVSPSLVHRIENRTK